MKGVVGNVGILPLLQNLKVARIFEHGLSIKILPFYFILFDHTMSIIVKKMHFSTFAS